MPKQIEKYPIGFPSFRMSEKINELIEVVNEQSKIIEDLKFRNSSGLQFMTCKHCHQRKPLNSYRLCAECFEEIKDKARDLIKNPDKGFKI